MDPVPPSARQRQPHGGKPVIVLTVRQDRRSEVWPQGRRLVRRNAGHF